MNRQHGFAMTGMLWGAVAAGAVILTLAGAVYVQTLRLTNCKAEYAKFVGGVEAIGEAAKKAARDKEAMDKIFKEKVDAQNARTTANLRATIKRLRDERAGGGGLSSPVPTAASPTRTCFDPALLDRAIRSLDEGLRRHNEGVLGIVESGSQAVIDLDSARTWAPSR